MVPFSPPMELKERAATSTSTVAAPQEVVHTHQQICWPSEEADRFYWSGKLGLD